MNHTAGLSIRGRRWLLIVVTGLLWFSLYAYVPILPPYAASIGATYRMVGLIVGSYGLSQMLMRIPLGVLSDAINRRKPFIVVGMLVSVASGVGLWATSFPWAAFAFRFLAGITAACWVTVTVLFCSYYEEDETPKAVGIINSVNATGQVAAMLVCGFLAQRFGMKAPFVAAGIAASIGLLLSLGIAERESTYRRMVPLQDFLGVVGNANLQVVSLLAVVSQLIVYSTVFGFAPIHAKSIGASSMQIGVLSTVSILPMVIVPILSGTVLVRRFGETGALTLGFGLAAISASAIPFSQSVAALTGALFLGGVARGIVFPLLMGMSIRGVAEDRRATAMGYFQAVYGLGMFVGPVVVGAIGDRFSLRWGFGFVGLMGLMSALGAYSFGVYSRRRDRDEMVR